jgi:hypothetical protein
MLQSRGAWDTLDLSARDINRSSSAPPVHMKIHDNVFYVLI